MSEYAKGDCRNHGGPIGSRPTTYNVLGKKQGYPENKAGPNRHDRRAAKHFAGTRRNTTGFPIGFNKRTWDSRCAELAMIERQTDVYDSIK